MGNEWYCAFRFLSPLSRTRSDEGSEAFPRQSGLFHLGLINKPLGYSTYETLTFRFKNLKIIYTQYKTSSFMF